jgi:hypothetical protein
VAGLRLLVVAVLAVGAGGAAAGRPASALVLVVEDAAGRGIVHQEPVSAGQVFSLSFVHSSERVPVRGTFRIEADGSLTAIETRFAGFGPGLPAPRAGDPWRMEDGMIVVPTETHLPELRLRVVPIAAHRLMTPSGRALDLSGALGPGGLVRILVRAM